MLRLSLNLFRRSGFRYSKPCMLFSQDKEPPKGFQKFQRKSKNQQEQFIQPNEEKKVSENTNQEEAEKTIKEDQQQDDQIPKVEKPQKKKYQFTYDPKSFNVQEENQKKEELKQDQQEKQEKQEEKQEKQENQEDEEQQQQQQQQQQEKKKFQYPKIDFSKFTEYLKNPQNRNYIFMFLGVSGLAALYTYLNIEEEITYTEFLKNYLETNQVSQIKVYSNDKSKVNQASIITTRGESKKLILGNVDHFLETLERFQTEKGVYPEQFIPVSFEIELDKGEMIDRALNLLYYGVSAVLIFYIFKSLKGGIGNAGKGGSGGNDVFGFGKSNVKQFGFEQNVKVKFQDLAGLDEAKQEIQEFVDFLKKPKKYKEMGAKLPRGALLAGPPGTGKTMAAKACAGEAGVPFFFVSGSDFVEMFVGVGASRVRDLFKQAKAKSPSIIFIDEIDAVGRKRDAKIGGNDERDNTLNQLLVEMDGFGTDSNVIVLAATNRKELLDPALTRPGRFDRQIDITLPDIEGRKQIFMVHLAPIQLEPSKTIEEYARRLATLTPGFSGAEIANLCNEAAIMAARANKTFVDANDFEMASERVMAGLEKKRIISEEERKTVAFHESGHAVVSWFLKGGHPLLKLTIIPRSKGSLGYAQYLPNESSLETKQELLDRICCILGGRVAEEIFFGQVTTGAYDDLKKAYDVAHSIVTNDGTNKQIDDEIRKLIEEQTNRTRLLINEKKEYVNKLASTLLEKETLDLQKIIEVLGERPFAPKSNYKAYLDIKKEDQETASK
ncbi:unnamed protein product [Paramecium pentaurelia]|uniref:AAA+ ATPase domain-containing protein n=1 Tax=Paramecium pentaurelia TaxID=43138 RepID=A0A8S1XN83_9CILI|nr:unnamed protein product [Paramecium pentaurelia]